MQINWIRGTRRSWWVRRWVLWRVFKWLNRTLNTLEGFPHATIQYYRPTSGSSVAKTNRRRRFSYRCLSWAEKWVWAWHENAVRWF